MDDGGKVSLHRFQADQKTASACKKKSVLLLFLFFAACSTSNSFLLVARHTLTTGLQKAFKVGTVNFANSLSPFYIAKNVHTGSKNSQGTEAMLGKSQGVDNNA